MNFLLLTIASLLAIAVLAVIASKLFPIAANLDEKRVRRNMLRYEPTAQIVGVFISTDRQTALVQLTRPQKTFGLVRQMGDRVVCRVIFPTDIGTYTWQNSVVHLSLQDFTQPTVTLSLGAADVDQVKEVIDSVAPQQEITDAA